MNELGKRLQELRQAKEISLQKVSSDLNVSNAAICKWENGINEPKASYIYKLAQYYGTTSDYLLGLEDDFGQKSIPTPNTYSAEERKLIEDYRTLSPALKKMLQDTIQTWQRSEANKKLKA